MKTLGELRAERGWSQAALADRLGVSRVTVARWETGTRLVPEPSRRLIALTFGVHPDAIRWPERKRTINTTAAP